MSDVHDLFIDGPVGALAVRTKGLKSQPKEVVIMVQGSNLTGQTMFDFSFPGGDDYSFMDAMTVLGFGAVTFSIRGYGASAAPEDGFSVVTETAMEDLAAVVDWVKTLGYARPHVLAFSWGGRIAGRYAQTRSSQIGRLVLYDPARGGGALVLPAPDAPWWTNTKAHYTEKLEPHFTDAALRAAIGDHVARREFRSPNGIRLENASYVTPIDPHLIINPTLLIYGEEAAKAPYMHGGTTRADFFEALAVADKAFVIVPGGGDFVHFQAGRRKLWKAVGDFLTTAPLA